MVDASVKKTCDCTSHIQQISVLKIKGNRHTVGSNPTSPVWLTKPPGMADSAT